MNLLSVSFGYVDLTYSYSESTIISLPLPHNGHMQEYCFLFTMFYKFNQISGSDSRQSSQL